MIFKDVEKLERKILASLIPNLIFCKKNFEKDSRLKKISDDNLQHCFLSFYSMRPKMVHKKIFGNHFSTQIRFWQPKIVKTASIQKKLL
jgi:hypothetical protein